MRAALTFDMGGRQDSAIDIIQFLIGNRIKSTLFFTGESIQTETGQAVATLVEKSLDLFLVGNHSWNHPNFLRLSQDQIINQLEMAEAVLDPRFGSTKPYFRYPYGHSTAATDKVVRQMGWRPVHWTLDTLDWSEKVDADQIVNKVESKTEERSIVLMHLGGWNTLDALKRLPAVFKEKNCELVNLRELGC